MVTATFGMVAACDVVVQLLATAQPLRTPPG
jgi:tRNA A37 threonylcarbamoyladenosine dehydratase